MPATDLQIAEHGFRAARDRRSQWEPLWRECYRYAQPSRGSGLGEGGGAGRGQLEDLFDGTAIDAVEQLAASLLSELTPPWTQWFDLVPGVDVAEDDRSELSTLLDSVTRRVHGHLERSNFAVEMHQCFLDLATIGTATLLFEETPPGELSAFGFCAVPAAEMFIDGDATGRVKRHYRRSMCSLSTLRSRFPDACDWQAVGEAASAADADRFALIEELVGSGSEVAYLAFVMGLPGAPGCVELARGGFSGSPFITFRWLKGTGELYGRSPVMSALPDIKTANKVVELILKNASLSVTGIWLAEDDGVLNPANIRLVPGSIIPKAMGSSGLTPLQAPGRLDVSQLVLDDLRGNIRHFLLSDRLAPLAAQRMTATEVLERSAEAARLLGAIFGRLQSELLGPLVRRALTILARRGEVPELALDGSLVELKCRSPIARMRAREEVKNVALWLETSAALASAEGGIVDKQRTVRWLADRLGVPGDLLADATDPLAHAIGRVLGSVEA